MLLYLALALSMMSSLSPSPLPTVLQLLSSSNTACLILLFTKKLFPQIITWWLLPVIPSSAQMSPPELTFVILFSYTAENADTTFPAAWPWLYAPCSAHQMLS